MNTLYVLFCDGLRARLYSTVFPRMELTLVYQQVSFGSPMPELAASLCRLLRSEFRTGKFETLAVIATGTFLDILDEYLDADCYGSLMRRIIRNSGTPPEENDLRIHLREMLADGGPDAPGRVLHHAPGTH